MPESYYDKHFPALRRLGFRRTSEPAYHNCIAYAVGDLDRKWWPGEYAPDWGDDYWPDGVPAEETVEAFTAALATVNFIPCSTGDWEPGYEKIALYAKSNGEVQHAARQMSDGTWRSTLGEDEDIEHTLEGLEGPYYGNVVAFFKRLT